METLGKVFFWLFSSVTNHQPHILPSSHHLLRCPDTINGVTTELASFRPTLYLLARAHPSGIIISPGTTTTMTEHARGRNERPQPDFFGKNRHQQAEASRLKSDHGDDLDDPAAAAASCPTSRKRQRSRSRERARTGLWGDGQEQLPGRNGMVVASNRSSPLEPLPETPRSLSSPRSLASLSPPSKSAGGESCDASSSDRPSLIEKEEEVARELGHREAFQSWRGHDDSLLSLMDEVMYDDDDVLLVEKNDTHSSPHDWRLALERFRAACRVSSSSSSSGIDILQEEDDSEVCYVPCDPVADLVPVALDEVDDRDERQEEEDP